MPLFTFSQELKVWATGTKVIPRDRRVDWSFGRVKEVWEGKAPFKKIGHQVKIEELEFGTGLKRRGEALPEKLGNNY